MRRLAFAAGFCAAALGAAAASKAFSEKGLRRGAPGMNRWSDTPPGQSERLPRAYPGAPALIPHSIDGLAIKRDANDCLGCHLEGAEVEPGRRATKVPASHFENPHTGEKRADRPVGMRNNCLQCHVPQAPGAEPPVPQAR
ncbi:MAG: nitrate reductase cytochrome c-type subunit [Elusimicrobia bacterium]|nr:nitrate reductase cytochrome c-type subunit [Elusimicrobiota bacterium]